MSLVSRAPRSRAGGFTMLEVVAAVAIVGIWFTMLVTLSSNSTRAERESQEVLAASLIADEALADAEAALVTGGLPQPYDSTTASTAQSAPLYGDGFGGEDYDVLVAVEPFDPLSQLSAAPGTNAPPLAVDLAGLPRDAQNAAAGALVRVRVEVRRSDDVDAALADGAIEPPPLASRTTFAIDPSVLAALANAQSANAPTPAASEPNEERDPQDGGDGDDF